MVLVLNLFLPCLGRSSISPFCTRKGWARCKSGHWNGNRKAGASRHFLAAETVKVERGELTGACISPHETWSPAHQLYQNTVPAALFCAKRHVCLSSSTLGIRVWEGERGKWGASNNRNKCCPSLTCSVLLSSGLHFLTAQIHTWCAAWSQTQWRLGGAFMELWHPWNCAQLWGLLLRHLDSCHEEGREEIGPVCILLQTSLLDDRILSNQNAMDYSLLWANRVLISIFHLFT